MKTMGGYVSVAYLQDLSKKIADRHTRNKSEWWKVWMQKISAFDREQIYEAEYFRTQ